MQFYIPKVLKRTLTVSASSSNSKQNLIRSAGIVLLIASVAFILYATLLFRTPVYTPPQLELFWSYKAWFAGDKSLGKEIIENILLFVPFGFSLALLVRKNRTVLLAALALTVVTELAQLIFGLGLFEWDDIINNTLGAGIGLAAARLLQHLFSLSTRSIPKKE